MDLTIILTNKENQKDVMRIIMIKESVHSSGFSSISHFT